MIGGLSGDRMLIGLAIGIIVLIFLVLKTKVQAFLALIISTIIVGVVGGMPLTNITLDDGKTFGIINSITTGFGGTLGSIGIIIGFGVMMGQIFEVTGGCQANGLHLPETLWQKERRRSPGADWLFGIHPHFL